MAQLSPAEQDALSINARALQAQHNFDLFTRFCVVKGDDDNPGEIPFNPDWKHLRLLGRLWADRVPMVLLKDRQLGVTWTIAQHALWSAAYNKQSVAIFSKGEREAKKVLERMKYVYHRLPDSLKPIREGDFKTMEVDFGEAEVAAFPSTKDAGISFTFQKIFGDEAAFHPYGEQNYAAYQPATSAGGVIFLISTADPDLGPFGFFHDMYYEARTPYRVEMEGMQIGRVGPNGFRAIFAPWSCRPDRDRRWLEEQRRNYRSLPHLFKAYYADTDDEAFTVAEGLVYPKQPPVVVAHPFRWEDARWRMGGVDFGGGDPTVALPIGISSTRHMHQFGELYERQPTSVTEIGNYLMQWHLRAPFSSIECDPSEPVAIQSLVEAGLPARAADNKRDGILMIRSIYAEEQFSIHESCEESIAEFGGYRLVERTDPHSKERYRTSTPVDNHADAHDARRYAIIRFVRGQIGRKAPVSLQVAGEPSLPKRRSALSRRLVTPRQESWGPNLVR